VSGGADLVEFARQSFASDESRSNLANRGTDRLESVSSPSTEDAPSNTLVLTGAFESASGDPCADLLESAPPTELNVLFVTLTGTATDCLARWRRNVALSVPANLGVVRVDEAETPTASFSEAESLAAGGQVWTISAAGDLSGLGRAISQFLTEWQESGNRTVICFDSATALLLNVDTERVFQFIHALTRRIEASDATARYVLNLAAHDDQTVRTIQSLFDTVVDTTADESGT
jgi:hypothetical protein